MCALRSLFSFFFNDTATTEIYTLSLHDALPILIGDGDHDGLRVEGGADVAVLPVGREDLHARAVRHDGARLLLVSGDRKSTRLNSSHQIISYAVFCLKKKKIEIAVS